jgi:type IX secretion system substrate protein/Reeler domain-containing protein
MFMKIRNVYKIAGLLVLYVVLQSRAGGPGVMASLEVTGAPGSTGDVGTCANTNCHTSGAFDPVVSLELLDGNTPVTKYEPGKNYTLKVTNTPGTGTPAGFGFQAVSLNDPGEQAGDWGDPGATMHVVTLSSRNYVEHSAPSPNGVFEVPWIAPAAGAGNVTFYSASNAVNDNVAPSGDGTASNSLAVEEGQVTAVFSLENEFASMAVQPNPVSEALNLVINSKTSGDFTLRIIGVQGVVQQVESLALATGANEKSFEVAGLAPGLYILQLAGGGQVSATQMIKL